MSGYAKKQGRNVRGKCPTADRIWHNYQLIGLGLRKYLLNDLHLSHVSLMCQISHPITIKI